MKQQYNYFDHYTRAERQEPWWVALIGAISLFLLIIILDWIFYLLS